MSYPIHLVPTIFETENPMPNTERALDFSGNHCKLSKPKWAEWERRRELPLWQAVTLARNIDPSNFQPYKFEASPAMDALFTPVPQQAKDLLDLAKSAIGSGTLKLDSKHPASIVGR